MPPTLAGAVALVVAVAACGEPTPGPRAAPTLASTTALPTPARPAPTGTPAEPLPASSTAVATSSTAVSAPTVATRSAALDAVLGTTASPPVTVTMTSIALAASVVAAGVDGDGAFALPPADLVGWYQFGPVPGAPGSAVLAGHVDFDGQQGALFQLRQASAGDEVLIMLDDGTIQRFETVAIEQYSKEQLPTGALFERGGEPRLVIITCGGEFDREFGHYRDNVVVYARPAP